MEKKTTKYLTKEKIAALESAQVMINKRKLAEQIFSSPQYKAHARKKIKQNKKVKSVALKGSVIVSTASSKTKSATSAKIGKPQAAK